MSMEKLLNFNKTEIFPTLAAYQNYQDAAKHSDNDSSTLLENKMSITVVLGAQSSGKTSLLTRLIGYPLLGVSVDRETTCLYHIKIRRNPKIDNFHVVIKTGDLVVLNRPLNLTDLDNCKIVKDQLKEEQDKLAAMNPDKAFLSTMISVEIQSSHFDYSYDLLDMPGLIDIETNGNANATDDLKRMVQNTCQSKNANFLVVTDSRQSLDNSSGLSHFEKWNLDKNWVRSKVVLTQCDGLMEDEQQRKKFEELLKNGNKIIRPENLLAIVNRVPNCKDLFADEQESKWWMSKYQNFNDPEALKNKLGAKILRKDIVVSSTSNLMDNVFPELIKTLTPEKSKIADSIKDLEKRVAALNRNPNDVIDEIKKSLEYIHKPTANVTDDERLKKHKQALMNFYKNVMIEKMNDVEQRLVNDCYEENQEDDEKNDISEISKWMMENQAIAYSIQGDAITFDPLFDAACKVWVEKIENDQIRKDMIVEFLSEVEQTLNYICFHHTASSPKLKELVKRVFDENRLEMENQFYKGITKTFSDYKKIVPYHLLTEKDLKLSRNENNEPIDDIKKVVGPFSKQWQLYMHKFIMKLKVDIQTAMRCDAITELSETLAKRVTKELMDVIGDKSKNLTADDFRKDDKNLEIEEELKKAKDEQAKLKKLIEAMEGVTLKYSSAL